MWEAVSRDAGMTEIVPTLSQTHTSMKGHGSLPPPLASSRSDETGRAGERWGGGHHRPLFEPKEYLSRQQKSREAMQA